MKKGIPYSTTYLVFHRDGSIEYQTIKQHIKKLKNITFLLIKKIKKRKGNTIVVFVLIAKKVFLILKLK